MLLSFLSVCLAIEYCTNVIYQLFKDWLLSCISYLWECIPPQTTKSDELFHAWKKTALHHAINVQEMADPYLKEARKFTQPYINQVAKMTRPLVQRVMAVVLKGGGSNMDDDRVDGEAVVGQE